MGENLKHITFERIDRNLIPDVFTNDLNECGSVVIFEGRVRADKIDNAVVEKIIYESYIEMAEKEFEEIEKETIEKFGVKKVIIKHRVGEVKVGEIALLVAILSGHRKEGFAAIQYVVDEVKRRVPIWKKEILSDGKTRWVEEGHSHD